MMNQSPAETALSRAMIRWSLTRSTPIAETAHSWIYKVEQNGRNFAALKILKPGSGLAERRRAELMNWYGGNGAAAIFDVHDNVTFMEWLDGDTLAEPVKAGRDSESTIALCTIIGQLHRPRDTAPPELLPLREHFQALFAAQARDWPHTARDLYARATGLALKLFDKPSAIVPLHGALDHDNVLSSPRGWLAIGPKGLLGDPTYEVANIFRGPAGMQKLAANPARIAELADAFSSRLGLNRKRLLGFAAAQSALSACWAMQKGDAITVDLAVLPHLLSAYDQA